MTAAVADRGVKFVVTTDVASDIAKPFQLVEAHVAALEKRLKGLTIQAPKIAGANGNGANGVGTNGNGASAGHAGAANADKLARDRERAAERGFRAESRWNRMAEAAVEKRSKAEEAAAKRAADVEKREIDRITKEREKALAEQTKADKQFWAEAIKEAKHARAERDREEDKNRRMLDKRLKDETKADKEFWDSFVKFGEDRAKFKQQQDKKEAQAKKMADSEARMAIAEHAERQAQLREGINSTIDSVSKLARGFTQLGLIGETDMHRIANAMLGVQGTIDTVRGALDGFRQFGGFLSSRGVGALSRELGPAAAMSAGPIAKYGGHLLKGIGVTGFGGGAALAGAGTAAAGGVLAAITSGLMVGQEASRFGFGGGAHAGSGVDYIASKEAAASVFANRLVMKAVANMESQASAPYGLSSHEQMRRSLKLLEGQQLSEREIGTPTLGQRFTTNTLMGGFRKAHENLPDFFGLREMALKSYRTEIESQLVAEEARARQQMIGRHEAFAPITQMQIEQRESARGFQERIYAQNQGLLGRREELQRGLIGEAFGRRLTAHAEQQELENRRGLGLYVNPAQEARVAQEQQLEQERIRQARARENASIGAQRDIVGDRHRELKLELSQAKARERDLQGQSGADSERQAAAREVLSIEEKIRALIVEDGQLKERQKNISVNAAREEQQIRQQTYAAAKQATDTLRGQSQSAKERFGAMLPEQQRSIIEAAKAMQSGHANRLQVEKLRGFSDLFAPELRRVDEQNAERGGYDKLLGASSMPGRIAAAEAKEKAAQTITIQGQNQITFDMNANLDEVGMSVAKIVTGLLEKSMSHMEEVIEERIKESSHETEMRLRNEGRTDAGG